MVRIERQDHEPLAGHPISKARQPEVHKGTPQATALLKERDTIVMPPSMHAAWLGEAQTAHTTRLALAAGIFDVHGLLLASQAGARLPIRVPCARVLLVDNEDLVRVNTAEMLAELGYEVIEAANAREALAPVDQGTAFDILITQRRHQPQPGAADKTIPAR